MPYDPDFHGGYWFDDTEDAQHRRAVDVLEAFRRYRSADTEMRRRTREEMSMGENDLLVVRYLMRSQREGRQVRPSELSKYLRVSTASTTAIVDRLEKLGHVQRVQHETDRRSIYVEPTVNADSAVRQTLGAMHERMMAAVLDLSPQEADTVIQTLTRLREAVDLVASDQNADGEDDDEPVATPTSASSYADARSRTAPATP
ncbi:MarR family winged helix-turn-helix transcriptional regulator [Microbacterium sp. P03]|uniref:MarR family winged helix-turn-helix transcriptional regulator n=1 Tax=Microbacterium sp. P03 TaxID=3366946 RepID=UPI0037464022